MDTDESKDTQQDQDLSPGGSETENQQTGGDDIEALKRQLEETKAKNVKLYNRLQENKSKPAPQPETIIKSPSELSREEVVLLSRGFEEDDLDYLKDLQTLAKMKGKEVSLKEAQEDERFKVWKAEKDRKARSERAQLGAGRGGSVGGTTVIKPGMTTAEHKKIWEDSQR